MKNALTAFNGSATLSDITLAVGDEKIPSHKLFVRTASRLLLLLLLLLAAQRVHPLTENLLQRAVHVELGVSCHADERHGGDGRARGAARGLRCARCQSYGLFLRAD